MNIFTVISDVYNASQAGQSMADARTWANRANAGAKATILLTVGLSLLKQFSGFDLGLSDADLQQIGAAVAIVGVSICNVMHTVANPNAGRDKKL